MFRTEACFPRWNHLNVQPAYAVPGISVTVLVLSFSQVLLLFSFQHGNRTLIRVGQAACAASQRFNNAGDESSFQNQGLAASAV